MRTFQRILFAYLNKYNISKLNLLFVNFQKKRIDHLKECSILGKYFRISFKTLFLSFCYIFYKDDLKTCRFIYKACVLPFTEFL